MENTKETEELIPVEKVLADMYDDLGIVSWSARDYYYKHYATEEERREMDMEDKIGTILGYIGLGILAIFIICALTLK